MPRPPLLALLLAGALAACARPAASPPAASPPAASPPAASETPAPEITLTPQDSGTEALLIGASAASEAVAWIGGTGGTVLRTTDGGESWQSHPVPGADSLQFRDVHAVSAQTAYLLSTGEGAASRIYKTTDGGATWTRQFQNDQPQAFFDCMAFWDAARGFAFSDAVEEPNGRHQFVIITTADGGQTWTRVPPERLPQAFPGEGSFAASGTCTAARTTASRERFGWIGTGNAAGRPARVLRTTDGGHTWQASPAPVDAGTAAGVASVVFHDARHGLALGGDIGQPARTDSSAARTTDGGMTWERAASPAFDGPVYGAAYVPGAPTPTLVAVGPGGASYMVQATRPAGAARSWRALDTTAYWGAAFASPRAGWLVGPEGRITGVQAQYRSDR